MMGVTRKLLLKKLSDHHTIKTWWTHTRRENSRDSASFPLQNCGHVQFWSILQVVYYLPFASVAIWKSNTAANGSCPFKMLSLLSLSRLYHPQSSWFSPKIRARLTFEPQNGLKQYIYIHMYVCMYVCMYVYIYMYSILYIHVYIYIYTYTYIYMCVYMCVYICIYKYIYIFGSVSIIHIYV